MAIEVLLSSGDVDTWEVDPARASCAISTAETPDGLFILEELTDDDQLDDLNVKKLTVTEKMSVDIQADGTMIPSKGSRHTVWGVLAIYAPGMWMRVSWK